MSRGCQLIGCDKEKAKTEIDHWRWRVFLGHCPELRKSRAARQKKVNYTFFSLTRFQLKVIVFPGGCEGWVVQTKAHEFCPPYLFPRTEVRVSRAAFARPWELGGFARSNDTPPWLWLWVGMIEYGRFPCASASVRDWNRRVLSRKTWGLEN